MGKAMQLIIFSVFLALFMHTRVTHNGLQNDELKPYLTEFVKVAKLFDKDFTKEAQSVTLQFGSTEETEYAVSNRVTDEITVNIQYWDHLDRANREELMWHELGHHFLRLDHYGNGIMKPVGLLGTVEYTKNYTHYINELFSRQPGTYRDIIWSEDKYND